MYVEYLYKPNKSQIHVNLTGFLKMNTAQHKHTSYFYQQWNKSSGHRHDEDVDFRPMEISQKIDLVPSEKHKTRCTFKMNCKTKLDINFRNLQNIRRFQPCTMQFLRKMLLGQNIRRTDGEVRDIKRHSLRSRNPSQYHMKMCHKGKRSNRNVDSKDQNICKIHVYAICV